MSSVKIASIGTPMESAERFMEIGRALSAIAPVISRSIQQIGEAAEVAGDAFRAGFTVFATKRQRRQMQTAIARTRRRPALINNGKAMHM